MEPTATRPTNFVKPEIVTAYKAVFVSEWGNVVMNDLRRIANLTKIDGANPNPYSGIYRAAQLALIQRITNIVGRGHDDD